MRPIALLTAFALLASGQQAPPPITDTGGFKISVTTNLVVVNVDVRDKNGKPLEGLKASDFTLSEDDKPQKLTVFEFQRLEGEALPPDAPSQVTEKVDKPAPKRAITPSNPGEIRYKDRRLMVLFFDFASMPQEDQLRAREAALKYVDTKLSPADMVSIMTFSNKLQVLEDFTNDRTRLRDVINSFRIGEGAEFAIDGATGEADTDDNGSAFTADETEFNVFNTDRKLGALEAAAKSLASLPEKKALVYFSSGVGKTGVENQSQLRATTNAAIRANVAFYPIDARGLMASAPGGNASQGSPRGTALFSGSQQTGMRTKTNDSQETLVTLAGDTGGKVMLDNNDLSLGIQAAQKDINSYYILGYYSTNDALDGRYRKVKVTLNPSLQAKVNYRQGYFAGKQFKNFNKNDKERQLEEAILLGDPLTDLPLAVEINYFRTGKATYFVPIAVKIPGSAVELAKQGKGDKTELDFIGQVRDKNGKIAGTVRDGISVKLTGDDADKLKKRNLQYDSGFTLSPGDYTLKFLARENVSGKMGTFESKFTVPDFSQPSPYLQTSSVIWSNQREAMSSSLASAEKDKKLIASHPLIQEGRKLVPSITRVYRKDQSLFVYLEVYDPGLTPGTSAPDIMASLSFFRGGAKAFETKPVRVDKTLIARKQLAAPVQFEIPLASLRAGKYTCQVNLVDEVGKKFSFARAPMVLLQ